MSNWKKDVYDNLDTIRAKLSRTQAFGDLVVDLEKMIDNYDAIQAEYNIYKPLFDKHSQKKPGRFSLTNEEASKLIKEYRYVSYTKDILNSLDVIKTGLDEFSANKLEKPEAIYLELNNILDALKSLEIYSNAFEVNNV